MHTLHKAATQEDGLLVDFVLISNPNACRVVSLAEEALTVTVTWDAPTDTGSGIAGGASLFGTPPFPESFSCFSYIAKRSPRRHIQGTA